MNINGLVIKVGCDCYVLGILSHYNDDVNFRDNWFTLCMIIAGTKITRNSSVDEIGERYRLKHAIVVKLYHPYTLFPSNVRLCYVEWLLFACRSRCTLGNHV